MMRCAKSPTRIFLSLVFLSILTSCHKRMPVPVATHPGPPGEGSGRHHPLLPNDSPIKIRGGSVRAISVQSWSASGNGYYTSLSAGSANAIWLNGVDDPADSPPAPDASGPLTTTTNWRVVIRFRNSGGGEDTDKTHATLTICSASDCGLKGPVGNMVYLQTDNMGQFDSYQLERYILSHSLVNPSSKQAKFIYRIIVEGFGTKQEFRCVDGACDIYIYHQ